MTDGLEVFVHDVIAAMTTWPLSRRVSVPSTTTGTLLSTCPASRAAAIASAWSASVACSGGRTPRPAVYAGGSEAGNDSASNSIVSPSAASPSSPSAGMKSCSAIRNAACASLSATRSCGRFGPASDGTTSPRSSAIVSE